MNKIRINNVTYDIAPYPIDIEPSILAKKQNIDGQYRDILRITVYGFHETVIRDFINDSYIELYQTEIDDDGQEVVMIYNKSNYKIASDIVDHRDGRITVYMIEPNQQDLLIETIKKKIQKYPELASDLAAIYPEWGIEGVEPVCDQLEK